MIKSFRDKDTEVLFDDRLVKRFQSFERPARRKLIVSSQGKDVAGFACTTR
jgi:plasmid maintenance system killer protein